MDSNERKIVQELVTVLGCVIPESDGYEPRTNLWNKYTAAKNLLAAAPQLVADERAAQHIPANFTKHRSAWRDAINECINVEETAGNFDQAAYWQHELAAFDRSFDRLLSGEVKHAAPVQAQEPEHVPVRPGHFPQRDPSKPAEQQGVFKKFDVWRTDGSSAPGGKHRECRYFVLDVDHDALAKPALQAYAAACAITHPELSADMVKRFDLAPVQPVAVPDGWASSVKKLVGQLEQYQLCMSYNDSYFTEPAGLVKQTVRQLSKLMDDAPAAQGDALAEREKFEEHFGPKDNFCWRNADDTYKNVSTQQAWEVWQAAIAAKAAS